MKENAKKKKKKKKGKIIDKTPTKAMTDNMRKPTIRF